MNSRRILVVVGLVLSALVAQAGLASPARAAGQRYAAPSGSGTACTSAAPCDIVTAVNGATSGTEVIIAAGTYTVAADLSVPSTVTNLNVHGAGSTKPVINTSANIGLQVLGDGAKVADLTINGTGSQWGLNVFAANITVQRVEVHTTAQVGCGLGYSGLVRDAVCVSSSPNGVALDDTWGGGVGVLTVRNVTAVATGAGSYGIRADSLGSSTNLDIAAKNVIAIGTKADIRSTETPANDGSSSTSSESDVLLTNSNYDSIEEAGGGNVTNVGSVGSNQTAAPIFVDARYHQAQSSPTVDKGTSDGSVGAIDIDGESRSFGTANDIGADEWHPDTTPPDVAFDHTPKRKTHKHKAVFVFHATEAATFACKLDKRPAVLCTSPFKAKFKKRGKHTLTVIGVDASGNVDPTPATFTWKVKKRKPHRHHPHHH